MAFPTPFPLCRLSQSSDDITVLHGTSPLLYALKLSLSPCLPQHLLFFLLTVTADALVDALISIFLKGNDSLTSLSGFNLFTFRSESEK